MEYNQKQLNECLEKFRQAGLRATHQRYEILSELTNLDEHPDADAIYRKVRKRIPTISLDTVYRTLRLLEQKGVIKRVGTRQEKTKFDANTERHHHFVCSHCGQIFDFYSDRLDNLDVSADINNVGVPESVYIELHGVCNACQKKVTPPS